MIKAPTLVANAHIENLEQQLQSSSANELDFLILAHPDQGMVNRLNNVFQNCDVAVIGLPQNYWSMGSNDMKELIDWVLSETSAKGILLVGHSRAGTPDEAVQLCVSGQAAPAATGQVEEMNSIFNRVKSAQAACHKTEQHFVSELNLLKDQISFHNGRIANPDIVQGLFYRAESGVFCAYDTNARKFTALIDPASLC